MGVDNPEPPEHTILPPIIADNIGRRGDADHFPIEPESHGYDAEILYEPLTRHIDIFTANAMADAIENIDNTAEFSAIDLVMAVLEQLNVTSSDHDIITTKAQSMKELLKKNNVLADNLSAKHRVMAAIKNAWISRAEQAEEALRAARDAKDISLENHIQKLLSEDDNSGQNLSQCGAVMVIDRLIKRESSLTYLATSAKPIICYIVALSNTPPHIDETP
ncbi:MAG: hypothetical protein WBB39_03120 [Candidatus Saccharimonadales bacterium]